jgi:outer membrane protein OmpA-like peptidoglycan-associated protein
MSNSKKAKTKSVAIGIVGLVSVVGVAVTGLIIAMSSIQSEVKTKDMNIDWASVAQSKLNQAKFDFLKADFEEGIVKISGDVPDSQTRARAFDLARRAVVLAKSAELASQKNAVKAFENNITVVGDKIDDVRDAISALPLNPQAGDCQIAYNILLAGHVVNFDSASALIASDSKPLLNALSAIAIRCVDYRVEVGGHTDANGDDFANQHLSERRAQAVADFLVGKGVPASQLTVRGYGETMLIDRHETAAADAKNRRIEFKISESIAH